MTSSGKRMTEFVIRAALAEETNNGWVWICGPSKDDLASRPVAKVRRPWHLRGTYETRKIDPNFLGEYNNDPKGVRIDINTTFDILVMGEWYRNALAIAATTQSNNKTGAVPLVVKKVQCWGWRSLRSACHHADPVVRLATRLGVLGTWLGLVALSDPAMRSRARLRDWRLGAGRDL
jgi:hypothetical protein